MYGINTYYLHGKDIVEEFIKNNCICLGYISDVDQFIHKKCIEKDDDLYEFFKLIKTGEIIFIKSYSYDDNSLYVEAIGIIVTSEIEEFTFYDTIPAYGRRVVWKKIFNAPIKIKLKYSEEINTRRSNILYEEYSPRIIHEVARLI
jgi:hypothetical protein